jgi:hypothetical protein
MPKTLTTGRSGNSSIEGHGTFPQQTFFVTALACLLFASSPSCSEKPSERAPLRALLCVLVPVSPVRGLLPSRVRGLMLRDSPVRGLLLPSRVRGLPTCSTGTSVMIPAHHARRSLIRRFARLSAQFTHLHEIQCPRSLDSHPACHLVGSGSSQSWFCPAIRSLDVMKSTSGRGSGNRSQGQAVLPADRRATNWCLAMRMTRRDLMAGTTIPSSP